MIIVRTPLRISIGGGGTDLPSYYEKYGSMFLSASIDKYIYITLHRSGFSNKIRCRYSTMEEVENVDEIKNEILRESLKFCGIKDNLEITSHAEIPSGTGLGSSGSFGVGILHALNPTATPKQLAEESTLIQMDKLNLPIGWQDQLQAAYGGFNTWRINKYERLKREVKFNTRELNDRLVMFFTGYNREANKILQYQKDKSEEKDMFEALHKTQEIGYSIKEALEQGNFDRFGELMNEHWEWKKKRSSEMTNEVIDKYYKLGLENGALGGKLIGAGGGGFLLFYTKESNKLIQNINLKHIPFRFVPRGSEILISD